jgi:glycosyltransferase involved in cell wall biosynthesis
MTRARLSAVIITFNEEKNLDACLENLGWADEIIVVDSHSTDRTAEIARKHKVKFCQVSRIGTGKIKNMGIDKAENEWILNVDADERIPEKLRGEIQKILEDPRFDGYYMPRKSFLGRRWIRGAGQWPDYNLRLFRKDKGRFQEKLVHERLILDGRTARLKNHMVHYNYDSWHDFIAKRNWYTTKEAQGLLGKRFVWVYPWHAMRAFFGRYGEYRKRNNSVISSYVMARSALDRYELRWTVPFKPFFAFLRFYLVQQGFRDGVHGLAWALG